MLESAEVGGEDLMVIGANEEGLVCFEDGSYSLGPTQLGVPVRLDEMELTVAHSPASSLTVGNEYEYDEEDEEEEEEGQDPRTGAGGMKCGCSATGASILT